MFEIWRFFLMTAAEPRPLKVKQVPGTSRHPREAALPSRQREVDRWEAP